MEQSGGQIAAKLAKASDGGEDRLSALHDDVIVRILECLDSTADAARTSVLARRWRKLWRLLTTLRFNLCPDGYRIRELLNAAPGDPRELRCISVTTQGADGDFEATWLPAAARLLVGGLVYRSMARHPGKCDAEEVARTMGCVELPCFEKATSIELDLGSCGLTLPSVGIFTRLTNLSLRSFEFRGTCDEELSNVVSKVCCPHLQKLSICYMGGVGNLSIDSLSLVELELKGCDLSEMTIVTPCLEKLSVHDSFPHLAEGYDPSEPVANITAPQILSLVWIELYDPRHFNLGNLGQLRELQTRYLRVYGQQSAREHNRHCLMLLQRFQALQSLHLSLSYDEDISDYQYLLGDITVIPHITFLQLELCNNGHAFGGGLFHLLRRCIALRRLSLVLYTKNSSSLEVACPSDCICDQPENWKTDELVLGHLEDVHITGLQGVGHEVAFVQRLLGWAAVLKSLRITLDNKMTEGKAMEFREALAGFSKPETCVQFDRIRD